MKGGQSMGMLRIKCLQCGKTWEVYSNTNFNQDEHRECPRCNAEIDAQLWKTAVIPAFCEMEDANRELYKDHTGYDHPLFKIDYEEDALYTQKGAKL